MINNKYTSLELSKKLKENGCDLESEMIIKEAHCKKDHNGRSHVAFSLPRSIYLEKDSFDTYYDNLKEIKIYKVYDLIWDICVKYTKEFFGDFHVCENCGFNDVANYYQCAACCETVYKNIKSFEYHSKEILDFIQQNKKQEAEEYIWKNCLFNLENKNNEVEDDR